MTRIIDLSNPLTDGLPSFPGDPGLEIRVHSTIEEKGCNLTAVSMGSHQGTHLDAPYHFYEDGKTLDRIPLERFYGPAVVIDFAPGGHLPAGTVLSVEMFEEYESVFTPGAKVLYRTGWDRKFGSPEFFEGFPDLSLEAARWIADRKIGLLGMDTPTPSKDFVPCHHILLAPGVEIVIVEGLTNLDQIKSPFTFAGFPLPLHGRDGAPIRAVAILED